MFRPGIFNKVVLILKEDKIPDPPDTNCNFFLPQTEQFDHLFLITLAFLIPVIFLQLTQ